MTVQELTLLGLKVSVLAIVFALGLRATPRDVVYLLGQPGLLVRSILSMNIVMPVFAVIVCLLLSLPLPVEIALVALSLSPVPPILPGKQTKAGGSEAYADSLLVVAAIISLVLIPVALMIIGRIFGVGYSVSVGRLISIILMSVIAPLFIGLIVRQIVPALAEKCAGPITLIAMILLVLSALPIAYSTAAVVWQFVGDGVALSLLLFSAVGLAVGHFLGGPVEDDRTVLALATATRHPAIAIAIAAINFPDEKSIMALALWHLIFAILISIPYVVWRKRVHATLTGKAN